MKHTRELIITLLVVLLSAFGCSDSRKSFPVPPLGTKANGFIMETRPFEIASEKYEADYGTITVPENRSKSSSRFIHLPFLRIRSQSKNPAEPIFNFSGGPGKSNMTWDWGIAWTFLSEHDFVLVGYRGVDGSSILDCQEVTTALRGDSDVLSEESIRKIGRAWSASAERLEAQGVDLDGYTMLECIEDIESVRNALGYKRIDILSASYGTRVAYLYGIKHPEHIFRSAMVCVNLPGCFVWEPQAIDAQLKYYAALWSKDSLMSTKSPDLYASMRTVLGAMPRRWLFFSIDPGKVRVVSFALLFHRKTSAMVFDSYIAAERGDPSGLALMSLAYDYILPSLGTWGDLASKAVSADLDTARDYCSDMDPPEMPLGSPLSKLLWGPFRYGRWPTQLLPEKFRTRQHSDVETLLLSGSVDFSTPAENATKELLPYLKNGKQVILSECGHFNDLWYANIENTRLIVKSFYDTGVPNTSLNTYIPMNFSVNWGFPVIAKVALGVLTFVGIALLAVIVWFIRRFRRGQALKMIGNATNA